jgi:hypothetical protein
MDASESQSQGSEQPRENLLDPKNTWTVGVKSYNDELGVTYLRGPRNELLLSQASTTARLHKYQPLADGCIRLLRRTPEPDENLLAFEFVTCSLADIKRGKHVYVAASYCWGDMPVDRRLGLQGDDYVPITAKVEQILLHLMSRSIARGAKDAEVDATPEAATYVFDFDVPMIWLDAICINQIDKSEKALQIPLMASIYRYARSVDIWFDSGTASAGVIRDTFRGRSISKDSRFQVGISRRRDDWLLEPYSNADITRLMWSPWFTRAWVAQEYCFAKKHRYHFEGMIITELFIKMVYDWGRDLGFSRVVSQNGTRCEILRPPMIDSLDNMFPIWNRVQDGFKVETNTRETLEEIICRFYSLKASDPRDKIFAMIGLASGDCLKEIHVDYDRPAPDVFLEAMVAMVRDLTNFSLLSFAGLAAPRPLFANRPDIPSWVPDFSTAPCHSTWSKVSRPFNASGSPPNAYVRSACAVFEAPGTSLHLTTTLKVHGVCCDRVAGVLRGEKQQNLSRIPKFIKKAMAVVESLRPYPSGESAYDVLRKTLIAANPENLENDPEGKGFQQFYDHVQGGAGKFNVDDAWATEGRYMQTMIMEGAAGSRGLFWTKNGYVGLADNEIEVGDTVWLMTGAKVPFVFRGPVCNPTNKKGHRYAFYRLVCAVYIHGFMDGELKDTLKESILVFLV